MESRITPGISKTVQPLQTTIGNNVMAVNFALRYTKPITRLSDFGPSVVTGICPESHANFTWLKIHHCLSTRS